MLEFRSGRGNTRLNQRKGTIHRRQRWINERTRQPYSGPVHYHNGRAMVGARHTSEPHDYLILAKSVNSNQCFSYGYYCEDEVGNGWCEESDASQTMTGQELGMAVGWVICERVEASY